MHYFLNHYVNQRGRILVHILDDERVKNTVRNFNNVLSKKKNMTRTIFYIKTNQS